MKNDHVRRLGIGVAAVLLASTASAQGPVTSTEDYSMLMKSNQHAFEGVDAALAARSFGDARASLALARKNFTALRGFWAARNRTDATRLVNDGLYRFSEIEELLGHKQVPVETVQQALKDFRSDVCNGCHRIYREGSTETGYHFKKGVL